MERPGVDGDQRISEWQREPEPGRDDDGPIPASTLPTRVALVTCVFATVTLGILPGMLSEVTRDAVPTLVAADDR